MNVLLAEFGDNYAKANHLTKRIERVLQATGGFTDQRQNTISNPFVYSDGTTTIRAGIVGHHSYNVRVEVNPSNEESIQRLRIHKDLKPCESDQSAWPNS